MSLKPRRANLPKSVWSFFGPLPVLSEPRLVEDRGAFGITEWQPRTITVDAGGCAVTQTQTFWHEATHVALWDSGVHNVLTHQQLEAVCDALGGYLAGMQLAGCLTVRAPKDA